MLQAGWVCSCTSGVSALFRSTEVLPEVQTLLPAMARLIVGRVLMVRVISGDCELRWAMGPVNCWQGLTWCWWPIRRSDCRAHRFHGSACGNGPFTPHLQRTRHQPPATSLQTRASANAATTPPTSLKRYWDQSKISPSMKVCSY